jgi:cation:H+ antiporter
LPDSLAFAIGIFVVTAVVIGFGGVRLAVLADRLADKTGWGEALLGGLFLAGVTSLPDFAATISAAADGYAALAMSNILGSVAVNFAFLAFGDLLYRKANLEHAAASSGNLVQAALLIVLLALPALAMAAPAAVLGGVHPVTPLLLVVYLAGYHIVRRDFAAPMWSPKRTAQTVEDLPEKRKVSGHSLTALWLGFSVVAAVTAAAGWFLMDAAELIADRTALSETFVGTLLTAVFTSLPELVTTIAAIRYGALTLAIGNILGTNCLNVVVIGVADVVYREGSIYHAVTAQQLFWLLLSMLLAAVLILGFLRRERYGIARMGLESFLIAMIYLAAVVSLLFLG